MKSVPPCFWGDIVQYWFQIAASPKSHLKSVLHHVLVRRKTAANQQPPPSTPSLLFLARCFGVGVVGTKDQWGTDLEIRIPACPQKAIWNQYHWFCDMVQCRFQIAVSPPKKAIWNQYCTMSWWERRHRPTNNPHPLSTPSLLHVCLDVLGLRWLQGSSPGPKEYWFHIAASQKTIWNQHCTLLLGKSSGHDPAPQKHYIHEETLGELIFSSLHNFMWCIAPQQITLGKPEFCV